jgi:uncharacterized protein (DUF1697 family)
VGDLSAMIAIRGGRPVALRRIDTARMTSVVFFRNLNLGRPNCPTRVQLEAAFLEAGATAATSFLTNGTLVFDVVPGARPRPVLADACQRLRASCGLREPAFVRTLSSLARVVAEDPFGSIAGSEDPRLHERCVTFLGDDVEPPALPCASARDDVRLLSAAEGAVFGLSLAVGRSFGSPNAFVERLLGQPASTRNWNTVVRLVERFGEPRARPDPGARH